MSTIDDTRWDLVLRRQRADFLYAVATMGIYCRPGCPSPRPKRENVRFFPDCAQAEAAGFRACRRCDPKGEREALARAVVADACAFIEAEEAIPALERLAERSGYSRFHFLRLFRDHTGLTPRGYAEGVRARRLQALQIQELLTQVQRAFEPDLMLNPPFPPAAPPSPCSPCRRS